MRAPLISLLVPTRVRITEFTRMYESAMDTAKRKTRLEIVAVVTPDDHSYDNFERPRLRFVSTRRTEYITSLWNIAWRYAHPDAAIYHLAANDIVYRTPGWDDIVRDAYDDIPDRIAVLFGDDGHAWEPPFSTHPFASKEWTDVIGRFTAPFPHWKCDNWLADTARAVDRYVHVPVLTEHMTYLARNDQGRRKARIDECYRAGIQARRETNLDKLYAELEPARNLEIDMLRRAIRGVRRTKRRLR